MATIKLKELFEFMENEKEISRETLQDSIKLLSPFCPHITEELYEKLGNNDFISTSSWPKFDSNKIKKKGEGIDFNEKVISSLRNVFEKIGTKADEVKKIYLYTIPMDLEKIDSKKLGKEFGKEIFVFATNNKEKHDPENKSKKALPGMPSIYLE
jgi:leucyl-tRNA synthetase